METRTSPSTGQPPSEKVIVDAPWLGTASGSDLGEDEGHAGERVGWGVGEGGEWDGYGERLGPAGDEARPWADRKSYYQRTSW